MTALVPLRNWTSLISIAPRTAVAGKAGPMAAARPSRMWRGSSCHLLRAEIDAGQRAKARCSRRSRQRRSPDASETRARERSTRSRRPRLQGDGLAVVDDPPVEIGRQVERAREARSRRPPPAESGRPRAVAPHRPQQRLLHAAALLARGQRVWKRQPGGRMRAGSGSRPQARSSRAAAPGRSPDWR